MTLYNATSTPNGIRFAKFDENMDLVAVYTVVGNTCDCPAAMRPTCKHRKMVPIFTAVQAVDSDQFYDYDRKRWERPLAEPEPIAELFLPADALTDKAEVHLETKPVLEPSPKPWRRL